MPLYRIFTQEDPIGLAGGLNLYGFAGGDPVNFSDPFGLYIVDDAADEGDDEPLAQRALGALKAGVGRLLRGLVGDAPASVDVATGDVPGTTMDGLVDAVLSPGDVGSLNVTATGYLGPAAFSSDGTVSMTAGFVFGATVDATYVAPGGRGDVLTVGGVGGDGLLGAASVGFASNGRPNSLSVSAGLGFGWSSKRIPAFVKAGTGKFNPF